MHLITAEIIGQVLAAGGGIAVEGDNLVLTAPRPLPADLLDRLKAHKPAIRAAIAEPDLSGVSPEFAARLSAEDLEDIAAGDILRGTVRAFEEAAIAREAGGLRGFFEERAAILQHDAGLPRPDAELEAARITATLAGNRGYLWASLRAALAEYPVLLAQVPDRPGPIDALPFGTAGVHVREGGNSGAVAGSIVITEAEIEAARKGRTVVRQGTFTGEHEVKA